MKAYRFSVEARLDGRRFENIRVDVGLGDPLIPPFDELVGSDLLSFASVPRATIRATSRVQHLVEKVHAVTRPFDDRINTRVKDLADILLLMNLGMPGPSVTRQVADEIFATRQTHDIPRTIETPPATWTSSFAAMATDLGLSENTLDSATARLNDYWTKLFP